MYNEIDLDAIDTTQEPPTEEPARQYYFMAKCREWVREFERKNGRRPFAFTQTFGRPMNFSGLVSGLRVRVRHAAFMTASIPPQTTAFEIRVVR